jgi:hypothetical protein
MQEFQDCSDKVKGRRFFFTVVARAGHTADPSASVRMTNLRVLAAIGMCQWLSGQAGASTSLPS